MTPEEMDAYVQKIVDKAPPLTSDQISKLRVLLAPAVQKIIKGNAA